MLKYRILFLFFVFSFLFSASTYSQNYNWITPNQTYLKMYVSSDGMYRINKLDFTNAGINTTGLDPRTVKVYYKGLQVPIYFFGEQDGTFDDPDYFDFYGQRNYGGLTNTYDNPSSGLPQFAYSTDEYFNLYSDTSVYWVGWNGSYGLRFNNYNNSASINYEFDFYYKDIHFESDLIYTLGINTGSSDYGNFSNEKYLGEGWYWLRMQNNNSNTQNVNVSMLSNSSQPCRLKIFAYPANQNITILNEHRLVFKVNTLQFDSIKADNFNRIDTTIYFSSSELSSGNNTINARYLPVSTSSQLYLDWYRFSYPRRFEFDSSYTGFKSDISDTSARLFKIKGVNSSNPVLIYDIKNGSKVINYSISNDTLYFRGKGDGRYEVLNKDITKKPLRIKQKSVPNLVTSTTGADYLIIYNKLFETPAEQLRQYRATHNNYRSFKAEIEDIYDVFNYGMENPVAIRRFAKNVFETWAQPQLQFLCLIGRGSVDPKKNYGATSVYYQNYIPVYGNPISDGYFANFNLSTFVYSQQVSVGRLPAYTLQETQDMVNKIITYESQTLTDWAKKPTFIAGGYTYSDQQTFINQSNYFISNYITNPPVSSQPNRIYLNDPSGLVVYNYSDSIKNTINSGTLLVNFMAHAGNNYWDYVYEDPAVLSNNAKLPLILSMTCFTGKNAEPNFRGYGEKYIYYSDKGAIGFIGATAWSFSSSGNVYNDYLLNAFSIDTLRSTGEILKKASITMQPYGVQLPSRTTINCYNLLGDPAVKLLLPKFPEFDIKASDVKLSDPNPPIKTTTSIKVFPRNLGTNADSCKVRFQILKNNVNYLLKDSVIYNFGYVDTLNFKYSIDSLGDYTIKINLDPENWWVQENSANNELLIPLSSRNISFVPLKPQNNQFLYNDTVVFTGINPNINTLNNSVKLLLQIDTTGLFNSPVLTTLFKNGFSGIVTKFNYLPPFADTGKTYFWRTNTILNNDTLGWSLPLKFCFSGQTGALKDSIIKANKFNYNQYENNEISFLSYSANNCSISRFDGQIYARSHLYLVYAPTYISVNMKNFSFDATKRGLNVAKVSRVTGIIHDLKNYAVNSTAISDSLVNFLNTFDTTHFMIAVKNYNVPGGVALTSTAINKIKQFGSVKIDSVGSFGWYNTWAFIGYLNAISSQVNEAFTYYPGGGADPNPAFTEKKPIFSYPSGTITQTIGPAQTWQFFNWEQVLYPNSSLKFDVYGINRQNAEVLLLPNVTTNNYVDLQGINAYQYPRLKLVTTLAIDTISGTQSPLFKGMSLKYVGPPEIALDNNSIFKSDSIVSMGDSVGIGGLYYNVGYVPVNGHTRNFYALDANGNKVLLRSDTIFQQLKVDSSMFIKATFKVNGLPIYKKYNNQIALLFEVNSLNQNDIYDYNNSVISTFFVKGSLTNFTTEVFSDGIKLFGNDYVRSKPELLVKLSGKSIDELLQNDTNSVRIMLNNNFLSLNTTGSKSQAKLNLTRITEKDNLILKFSPELKNGLNELKIISLKDNSTYDTTKFALNVTSEVSLINIFNFPNPMKNDTKFDFILTGSEPPSDCRIKIYTTAGRVIKEIVMPVSIGYNQIYWDGRDADGDNLANGVYFYRIFIRGNTEITSDVKKLVVLR